MESHNRGISFRDHTVVTGDVVGGNKYDIKFYAFTSLAADGQINWAQYRTESKNTEPYKFLSYYDTTDADIFFGRETVSQSLTAKITTHKLVLINGKSGSGKTSLINAGIIPRLIKEHYFTIIFRDYGYPTETIKTGLANLENVNLDLSNSNTLVDCIRTTTEQTERPVAIFMDQFERFFLNLSTDKRQQFIGELKDCLNEINAQNLNLVISLREDFFGRLGEFWKDIPDFNTESYSEYLEPLNETEATDAIAKPLEKIEFKVGYEPEFLTDCLVPNLLQRSESESNKQIEPVHLQIVCNRLFKEVRKRYFEQLEAGQIVMIKQELYKELGGVEGILQGYLQEILNQNFSRQQQDEVKTILKEMVTSQGTREFRTVIEIVDNLSIKKEKVEEIIQQLDQSRLIETISGEDSSQKKYSITHEFLAKQINQWYTLNELELKRATELYERCLENWNDPKNRSCIPRNQFLFLQKYKTALLKWKPEGEQLFRRSRLLYYGRDVLIVSVLIGFMGFIAVVIMLWQNSNRQREIAEIDNLATKAEIQSDSWPEQIDALQLAMEAANRLQDLRGDNHNILDYPMTRPITVLQKILDNIHQQNQFTAHNGSIIDAVFSSNSQHIATVGVDGKVRLWNLSGQKLDELTIHNDSVQKLVFSPDGQHLAVVNDDSTIRLWNLSSKQSIKLKGHSIAFSPVDQLLVTFSNDNIVRLFDFSGQRIRNFSIEYALKGDIVFSPDGHNIAIGLSQSGNFSDIYFWDLLGQQSIKIPSNLQVVGISKDWETIATIEKEINSSPRSLKLFNIVNSKLITEWKPNLTVVPPIALSSDGKVVTSSNNGFVQIGNQSGQQVSTLQPMSIIPRAGSGRVRSILFSPDGKYIATRGMNNTVRLWSQPQETPVPGQPISQIAQLNKNQDVTSINFSEDGKYIIAGYSDGQVIIWNSFPKPLHKWSIISSSQSGTFDPFKQTSIDGKVLIKQHDNSIEGFNLPINFQKTTESSDIFLSSDGTTLVVFSDKNKLDIWDLREGFKQLGTIDIRAGVRDIDVSYDGKMIATLSNSGTLKIWSYSGEFKREIVQNLEEDLRKIKFDINGGNIIVMGDTRVKIWQLSGQFVTEIGIKKQSKEEDESDNTFEIGLNSSQNYILSLDSVNNRVKTWDFSSQEVSSIQANLSYFNSENYVVKNFDISLDGKFIATIEEGVAYVKDLSGNLVSKIESSQDSYSEVQFSPDSQTLLTFDNPTVQVWTISGEELFRFEVPFTGAWDTVFDVSFSKSGSIIVTGRLTVKVIHIYKELSKLLEQGCKKMQDYFISYPRVKEELGCLYLDQSIDRAIEP